MLRPPLTKAFRGRLAVLISPYPGGGAPGATETWSSGPRTFSITPMLLLLFLLLLFALPLNAQNLVAADSALARELDARVRLDQAARELVTLRGSSGEAISPEDILLIATVDSLNTVWLKELVSERGWPRQSEVGKQGAHHAWLLVQHADRNPAFQEAVLPLIEQAVARGEASASDFAYLTDRVRVARGEPQLYGTQFRRGATGAMEPYPIQAPDGVDSRRAAMGLPSLQEYLNQVELLYGNHQ
jgi:hypothetical protein